MTMPENKILVPFMEKHLKGFNCKTEFQELQNDEKGVIVSITKTYSLTRDEYVDLVVELSKKYNNEQ